MPFDTADCRDDVTAPSTPRTDQRGSFPHGDDRRYQDGIVRRFGGSAVGDER